MESKRSVYTVLLIRNEDSEMLPEPVPLANCATLVRAKRYIKELELPPDHTSIVPSVVHRSGNMWVGFTQVFENELDDTITEQDEAEAETLTLRLQTVGITKEDVKFLARYYDADTKAK
jgi:hypothetical protein